MHISDELRKNQMLHGGVADTHDGRGHPQPHVDLHEHHKRAVTTTPQLHRDMELHPAGEPVYNQLHHTEAHGHPPAEVNPHHRVPVHKDHHMRQYTDDVDADLEPLKRSGYQGSSNVMDHYDEVEEERKSRSSCGAVAFSYR